MSWKLTPMEASRKYGYDLLYMSLYVFRLMYVFQIPPSVSADNAAAVVTQSLPEKVEC